MFMAITTKTGLAPGVALSSLRPYVEKGLTLSGLTPPAGVGGGAAGMVGGVGEGAGAAAAVAEAAVVKNAVMQVLLDDYRVM